MSKVLRNGVSCKSTKCKWYTMLIEWLTETDEWGASVPVHCQTCKRCWFDKFEHKEVKP